MTCNPGWAGRVYSCQKTLQTSCLSGKHTFPTEVWYQIIVFSDVYFYQRFRYLFLVETCDILCGRRNFSSGVKQFCAAGAASGDGRYAPIGVKGGWCKSCGGVPACCTKLM